MISSVKKRIAPSVPLTLECLEDNGTKRTMNFRLSWSFNTSAEVEERTGLNLLTGQAWANLSVKNLGIMLWAAILGHHPEFGGRTEGESFEEFEKAKHERQEIGLEAILSFIDLGNVDKVNDGVWDAYFLSLPKEKRDELEKAKRELLEAAKVKARPLAEEIQPQPDQPGSTSGPSPVMILDSPLKNSESSPMRSSTLSASAGTNSTAQTCTTQA